MHASQASDSQDRERFMGPPSGAVLRRRVCEDVLQSIMRRHVGYVR